MLDKQSVVLIESVELIINITEAVVLVFFSLTWRVVSVWPPAI